MLPILKQLEDIYKTGQAGDQQAREMGEDWYNIPRGWLDAWMHGGKADFEKPPRIWRRPIRRPDWTKTASKH